MKTTVVLSAAICIATFAVATSSFAAPQFLSYEGRNAVHEGQGGEKKAVDGIDFWMNGEPALTRS